VIETVDVAWYELRSPVPPLPSRSPVAVPEPVGVVEPVGFGSVPFAPGRLVQLPAAVLSNFVPASMSLATVTVTVSVSVAPGATTS
jgi:hypothetical protein